MAEMKRYRLRQPSRSFGTLLGGALLGLLIGAGGGVAAMPLVADDGSDGRNGHEHPGRGNAFGHDKQKHKGDPGERCKAGSQERGGGQQGLKMGLENGNGPDGKGPPGLLKKR